MMKQVLLLLALCACCCHSASIGYGSAALPQLDTPVPVAAAYTQTAPSNDLPITPMVVSSYAPAAAEPTPAMDVQPTPAAYVAAPAMDVVQPTYTAPAYTAPAAVEQPAMTLVSTGYGASNTESAKMETMAVEAPQWMSMCAAKRTAGTLSFYVAHPESREHFLQCDQFGKAFVMTCPSGTVFTPNMVCERHMTMAVMEPVMASKSVSTGYGAMESVVVPQVEWIKESPEFKQMCVQSRSSVGRLAFYLSHPASEHMFIQCDEFGKAFSRMCPNGMWFSETDMVCEEVKTHQMTKTTTGYGQAAAPMETTWTNEFAKESPEFKQLCMQSRAAGHSTFYWSHPASESMFIQCDQFGKAFTHTCPAGTWFSENNVCEFKHEHAPTMVKQESSYGSAAPVQTAPVASYGQTETVSTVTAQVESIKESPEFKQMCAMGRTAGRLAFYMSHPASEHMFIQCDEFGKAFSRMCPNGMWFNENDFVCEDVKTHVIGKQEEVTSTGYGQAAPMETTNYAPVQQDVVQQVVATAPVNSYVDAAPVAVTSYAPAPQQDVVPVANYAAPAQQDVLPVVAPVASYGGYGSTSTTARRIKREMAKHKVEHKEHKKQPVKHAKEHKTAKNHKF